MGIEKQSESTASCRSMQNQEGKSVHKWVVDEVTQYLQYKGFEEFSSLFKREKICGKILLYLTDDHLKDIGISAVGDRLRILLLIEELKEKENQKVSFGKVIHDPIHGSIRVHPLCIAIIDTPEFQRLRYLKQLGCSSFVFPSATHTRFEHSIGVHYLAEKLMQELRKKCHCRSGESITDEDILCVSIAGLCHDLGHGPFSHMWEHFMSYMRSNSLPWKHEEMSVKIFNRIWDKIKLEDKMKYNLNDSHKKFIGELISGQQSSQNLQQQFLYEIVANKSTGIDVDKWDYVMRDGHYLGIKISFDYQRLLQFIRITTVNGKRTISFKDSEAISLYQMFHIRYILHRQAYKHRVSRIIERMILDALMEANSDLLTSGSESCKKKLSETVDDIEAFMKLNDSVYHRIRLELPESHPAFKIIEKIESRNIYKSVDEILLPNQFHYSPLEVEEEMIQDDKLENISFYIDIVTFDYGMNDKDPIKFASFYEKRKNEVVHRNENFISKMLPTQFEETKVYCVSRDDDKIKIETLKKAFRNWLSKKKLIR